MAEDKEAGQVVEGLQKGIETWRAIKNSVVNIKNIYPSNASNLLVRFKLCQIEYQKLSS